MATGAWGWGTGKGRTMHLSSYPSSLPPGDGNHSAVPHAPRHLPTSECGASLRFSLSCCNGASYYKDRLLARCQGSGRPSVQVFLKEVKLFPFYLYHASCDVGRRKRRSLMTPTYLPTESPWMLSHLLEDLTTVYTFRVTDLQANTWSSCLCAPLVNHPWHRVAFPTAYLWGLSFPSACFTYPDVT